MSLAFIVSAQIIPESNLAPTFQLVFHALRACVHGLPCLSLSSLTFYLAQTSLIMVKSHPSSHCQTWVDCPERTYKWAPPKQKCTILTFIVPTYLVLLVLVKTTSYVIYMISNDSAEEITRIMEDNEYHEKCRNCMKRTKSMEFPPLWFRSNLKRMPISPLFIYLFISYRKSWEFPCKSLATQTTVLYYLPTVPSDHWITSSYCGGKMLLVTPFCWLTRGVVVWLATLKHNLSRACKMSLSSNEQARDNDWNTIMTTIL